MQTEIETDSIPVKTPFVSRRAYPAGKWLTYKEVYLQIDDTCDAVWQFVDGRRSIKEVSQELAKKLEWSDVQAFTAVSIFIYVLLEKQWISLSKPIKLNG